VKKKVLLLVVLLILVLASAFAWNRSSGVEVHVARVRSGDISRTVSETGYLVAQNEVRVYAQSQFAVEQVFVQEGTRVSVGDVLVFGDTEDLRLRLAIIESNLSAAKARYFAASQLEVPAALKRAEAEADAARIEHERALDHVTELRKKIGSLAWLESDERTLEDIPELRNLYLLGFVQEKEWEAAVDRYELATARLKSAEAAVREAMGLLSPEGMGMYLAQIDALSLEAETLRHEMTKRSVTSPIDGTVVDLQVKKGAVVLPGSVIATIYSHDLKVVCEVLAQDMPLVSIGQEVLVHGDSLGGEELLGKISKISSRATESLSDLGLRQRRVRVEIALTDPRPKNVLAGYPVDVDIVVGQSHGMLIPAKALFEMHGKHHVFIVRDGRAVLSSVVRGIETDTQVEIVLGLSEDDSVVVSPPRELSPDAKVRIKN